MKRFLLILILALAYSAPSQAHDKLHVVASFSILADMARNVAGDEATVTSIVPAGTDLHGYEPSPRDVRSVAGADLILINGLGLEGWLENLLRSADAKAPVVAVSGGVTPLHHGNMADPHAWQDIANGQRYVLAIAQALSRIDPAHAAVYQQNASSYNQTLGELAAWTKAQIGAIPAAQRRAITSHDALHYFGAAYGIELIPAQGLSTEGEISAGHMATIIDQIRKEHIRALFLENMSNPRLIQQLAEETHAIIGGVLYSDSLSPSGEGGDTYISMFRHNVNTMSDALRK